MSTEREPTSAENVGAFYRYRQEKGQQHRDQKWVLVANGEVKGAYGSYESAFIVGIKKFAELAFLIREMDQEEPVIPFVFTEA